MRKPTKAQLKLLAENDQVWTETREQAEKEGRNVILLLTPDQSEALEAGLHTLCIVASAIATISGAEVDELHAIYKTVRNSNRKDEDDRT